MQARNQRCQAFPLSAHFTSSAVDRLHLIDRIMRFKPAGRHTFAHAMDVTQAINAHLALPQARALYFHAQLHTRVFGVNMHIIQKGRLIVGSSRERSERVDRCICFALTYVLFAVAPSAFPRARSS